MIVVYDSQHYPLKLTHRIHKGGQATIHPLIGHTGWVAKIYKSGAPPGYDQKLAWMLANPLEDPSRPDHVSIAWPLHLLYDEQRQVVGYLMPYTQNTVTLFEVFIPGMREKLLPHFNRVHLHRTAQNLATILSTIHKHGSYLVGDINPNNFLVTPTELALVTVVDTDSFQVQTQNVFHRCPVVSSEYAPPEFQGESIRLEHDYFGLGVLIFQLLMEGRHPFDIQWLGSGDPPSREDCIRAGLFPYAQFLPKSIAPPKNATLKTLHHGLADLMRCCFVAGHQDPQQRPTPEMWISALTVAEKTLVPCHHGHYHFYRLHACPECIEAGQTPVATNINISPLDNDPREELPYTKPNNLITVRGWVNWVITKIEIMFGIITVIRAVFVGAIAKLGKSAIGKMIAQAGKKATVRVIIGGIFGGIGSITLAIVGALAGATVGTTGEGWLGIAVVGAFIGIIVRRWLGGLVFGIIFGMIGGGVAWVMGGLIAWLINEDLPQSAIIGAIVGMIIAANFGETGNWLPGGKIIGMIIGVIGGTLFGAVGGVSSEAGVRMIDEMIFSMIGKWWLSTAMIWAIGGAIFGVFIGAFIGLFSKETS